MTTATGLGPVLGIERSILGQPWRWRRLAEDARDGLSPDDLHLRPKRLAIGLNGALMPL